MTKWVQLPEYTLCALEIGAEDEARQEQEKTISAGNATFMRTWLYAALDTIVTRTD
ncbi:hypothetical protein [Massilia sp. CFBP9026]|uniref:hypothetical protein n=1 Tax=Massilia sp. CFBP9026 TaxID=3096536 RepID=UPI002A6B4060|nr:hypothetical protein [Massilia sp. CFBP9026]MDY0965192.1 hypothetical protein [Massilia sp. CFBP9026]